MLRPIHAVSACCLLAVTLLGAHALSAPQTETPAPQPPAAVAMTGPELFADKGCSHCHGARLEGSDRGPDLRGVGRRLKPEQLEGQIHDGGQNMPPFAEILEPAELKTLVAYLAKMKAKPHPHR